MLVTAAERVKPKITYLISYRRIGSRRLQCESVDAVSRISISSILLYLKFSSVK